MRDNTAKNYLATVFSIGTLVAMVLVSIAELHPAAAFFLGVLYLKITMHFFVRSDYIPKDVELELDVLRMRVEEHRRAFVITCPETCWCWDLEKALNIIDSEFLEERDESDDGLDEENRPRLRAYM